MTLPCCSSVLCRPSLSPAKATGMGGTVLGSSIYNMGTDFRHQEALFTPWLTEKDKMNTRVLWSE